ncbi:MAG: sigma-70 family RNA polymerase sigma factor, partial [Bacteroidales bacterium]|nr:sigma-70 family RNA polymerase sigma factor [Bacteroidales bacterium]
MDSQAELISRCRRRERSAQFELYRLYARGMFAVCQNILADTMEAEDAMQEAFFKAFDKIDQYRGQVAFGAWLKRIVVNTCIDHLKRQHPPMLPLDELHAPHIAAEDGAVEASLEAVKAA